MCDNALPLPADLLSTGRLLRPPILAGMMLERVKSLRADIAVLEQSIERAGLALGCAYSSQQEFESALARARRGRSPLNLSRINQLRVALGATAVTSLLAIILLAF